MEAVQRTSKSWRNILFCYFFPVSFKNPAILRTILCPTIEAVWVIQTRTSAYWMSKKTRSWLYKVLASTNSVHRTVYKLIKKQMTSNDHKMKQIEITWIDYFYIVWMNPRFSFPIWICAPPRSFCVLCQFFELKMFTVDSTGASSRLQVPWKLQMSI